MPEAGAAAIEPFFLDSPEGPLFAIHHRPGPGRPWVGNVLCCMPFNEEMNRCRTMVTLLAQRLAGAGIGLLVVDLLGTGDSAGEFSDARWDTWLDNLEAGRLWLTGQTGGCTALLGIRLGAILAARVHARHADPSVALAFWQPVADGGTHLTQFMRVRIAASLDRPDLPKETTASMRAQWAQGESVEIAGYALHPALASAIDGARLDASPLPAGTRVLWLEQQSEPGAGLGPASSKLLARWPGASVKTDAQTFAGPPFWQMHERALAPAAADATVAWLVGAGGVHA